ncbi:MAG: cytochrome-c peroxidase [Epsilonproteobacteria bacterium]|nr:cytochrome-c peroxidase [Campylobacterota bacterium]
MLKYILLFCITFLFLHAKEPITPIPLKMDVDKEKAALGNMLFFDPMLSRNDTISCASCHDLQNGGDDGLKFSFGIDGKEGSINAPTVYNTVFNFWQFWDGRAKTLKEQAAGPIENPVEMGFSFKELIPKLKNSKYNDKFQAIYKEGITKETITDAIAEYEKTLITPNAPFDKYLRGDTNALTQKEKEGYELFKTKGCISCHHGVNLGGNLYNKFGVFEDPGSKQLGRYNVTKKERDKFFFKVPTLRNIELTAPYFHDGRTYDLKEAVLLMAQYQLGRDISNDEVEKILAFLHSLNGELPKNIEPR